MSRPKKTGFTGVYMSIPDEILATLKKQADEENRTMGNMYTHCMKQYVRIINGDLIVSKPQEKGEVDITQD